MPATDSDVQAARQEVDELREELRAAKDAAIREATAGTNDSKVARLETEAERLRAEIAQVRGVEQQAPSPAPVTRPTPPVVPPNDGDDAGDEN